VKGGGLASEVAVPLVFLHGSVADPSVWLGLRKWMGAKAIGWDLLVDADLSFDGWTQRFVTAMRRLGRASGPPVVVGYSLGARMALHALQAAPELFSAAVLVGPNPGMGDPGERSRRLGRDRQWARKAREMSWQSFLDEWDAQSVLQGSLDPAVVRPWQQSRLALEARRLAVARTFEMWSPGIQQSLVTRLSKVSLPVMLVAGGEDERYARMAVELAGLMPEAESWVVAGAGHRLPWELPGVFFRGVGRFCGCHGLLSQSGLDKAGNLP